MKIKKSQLKRIIKEGIKVVLNEADALTSEQEAFVKPIFEAAAKKGKFKLKGKMFAGLGGRPQAEIEIFKYGKDGGSMVNIWGWTFTKSEASALGKSWEKLDGQLKVAEKGYEPSFHIAKDTYWMQLHEAAKVAGIKYDRKEYDNLFR